MRKINHNVFLSENEEFLQVFSFIQDKPESVLFLFDLASHFNLDFDEDTLEFAKDLRSTFRSVKDFKIWEYWSSWAVSEFPGSGLLFLQKSGWLELFPEIFGLIGISQNEVRHPEGDVFTHACLAVNEAAKISIRESLKDEETLIVVFGALCHDIGKQVGMDGHEIHGVDVAKRFLTSIGAPYNLTSLIQKIVRHHMVDYIIDGKLVTVNDVNKEFVLNVKRKISPLPLRMLFLVHEADTSGRGEVPYDKRVSDVFKKMMSIDENNNILFTSKDFADMIREEKLPYPLAFRGMHRNLFVKNVNKSLRKGSLRKEEIRTVLSYVFRKSYRDAVFYVDELDYRSTAKLLSYMNENNVDLDTLLLKGKSGIEEILNHSDL